MRFQKPWLWGMSVVVAGAVVAAIALWPHAPTEPVNDFSHWRQVSKVEVGSQIVQVSPDAVVSWDHGFLMTAGIGQAGREGVLTSDDGLHWTASFPPGLKPRDIADVGGDVGSQFELTAYGSTVYLIGVDDTSPDSTAGTSVPSLFYDVWTSTDGTTWTKVADRLSFLNEISNIVGFAAGPRGILLLVDADLEDSRGFYDLIATEATLSKDGRTWPQPVPVPVKTDFEPSNNNTLTANSSGFTITGSRSAPAPGYDDDQGLYLTSPDGVHWSDLSAVFPSANELRVMADGTSGTVICGNESVPLGSALYGMDNADGALTCWYRQHGDPKWQARLPEAGRLPDVGAAALDDQEVCGLYADQDTFIAVGTSVTGQTAQVGAIWVSADAMTWKKLPTAANDLTHFLELSSVAEYDGVAIATGWSYPETTSYEISTPQNP